MRNRRNYLLEQCGVAMYGVSWQASMAKDLKVDKRTVRRWCSGASPMPIGVWYDIIDVQEKIIREIHEISKRIGIRPKD